MKIDAVILYVNDSDPVWLEQAVKYGVNRGGDVNAGTLRYKDDGTLELVLLSIRKFAPWIDDIYLVVSSESQVPEYAKDKVKVILHEEFIPKECLPCFSSACLECFFPFLPGVSESFVFFNDDTILTSSIPVEMFFDGENPKVNVWESSMVHHVAKNLLNCYNVVMRSDQNIMSLATLHCPTAMKMSWLKECFEEYKEEIMASICNTRRTDKDLCQYMYSWYNFVYKGASRMSGFKCRSLSGSSYKKFDFDSLGLYHEICMNGTGKDLTEYVQKVKQYINENQNG